MYRIMSRNRQVRERRNQLRHPCYEKPQLVAVVAVLLALPARREAVELGAAVLEVST